MADRYWVGGAGSWNSTTKWSTSSGGASGASVPTTADNAIFDDASGTAPFTVTVTTGATCANLSITPDTVIGYTIFDIQGTFVIAGTLSTSTTAGNRRILWRSSTIGLKRDVSVAAYGTITDMDFRDIRIVGAGGTLSGTRIGNAGNNDNITFSAPKDCFRKGTGNWSDDQWASTQLGTPSTDFFPLPQDTAKFTNDTTVGTHTLDSAIPYMGTLDCSSKIGGSAVTIAFNNNYNVYGNITLATLITISGSNVLFFAGGKDSTQTLITAGKSLFFITINSVGGVTQLGDALTCNTITVTYGTFETNNYAVTATAISSTNSNVRTIDLGTSAVTLSGSTPIDFGTSTNLTFLATSSTITITGSAPQLSGGSEPFGTVNFTSTTAGNRTITGTNTFVNLSFTAPASGLSTVLLAANQTITGTLTCSGATAIRRMHFRSSVLRTQRTVTVTTFSPTDCNIRDIAFVGGPFSGTRVGDEGNNSGFTFDAPKTVYWNLSGTQNWSATGWAPGSGGTPNINNFPLPQDTAKFDDLGAAGTVTIDSTWSIGTIDMASRTTAMTFSTATASPVLYGDLKLGTGVTVSSQTNTINFQNYGTSTITSNGVTIQCPVTINVPSGTVQLADALTLSATRTLTLTKGTFDAVTYNVSVGLFAATGNDSTLTVKMGTGTWTLSGTGTVWNLSTYTGTVEKSTANIVLSDTSTTARTFNGGIGIAYNKLTIGGTTGISTTSLSVVSFSELASTKTVAHTISLISSLSLDKWSVTGTAGNVVTVNGSQTLTLVGDRTTGIDYLAMSALTVSATGAEFYAGANSTVASTGAIATAPPAAVTRYWVGGSGTWSTSSTTNWSDTSGGAGGFSVPTSADTVIFDDKSSTSNAAYTVTIAGVQSIRCGDMTVNGPGGSSKVTFAHPRTGTSTFSIWGSLNLAGGTAGIAKFWDSVYVDVYFRGNNSVTLDSNGVALELSDINLSGTEEKILTLGSALAFPGTGAGLGFYISAGTFDTGNFNLTINTNSIFDGITPTTSRKKTINFGSSTLTLETSIYQNALINFANTNGLTFNCGTSTITHSYSNDTNNPVTFNGGNQTFYNVDIGIPGLDITATTTGLVDFLGNNTFNNLTFRYGGSTVTTTRLVMSGNQTVNGTFSVIGTSAVKRCVIVSDTAGTQRTITAAACSYTDCDFADIKILGGGINTSGTRVGNIGNNSGITFDTPKTVYRKGTGNWNATQWALSGGSVDVNNFPLPQDTAIFDTNTTSGTITINIPYYLPSINASNSSTITLSMANFVYYHRFCGDLILGSSVTLSYAGGSQGIQFVGDRNQNINLSTQNLTSAVAADIIKSGGSFLLQNNLTTLGTIRHYTGTIDLNGYNLTSPSFTASDVTYTNKNIYLRTGTWTLTSTGTVWDATGTGITVYPETSTILLSNNTTTGRTFAGGGYTYNNLTIGGNTSTSTTTITGNNTFNTIASTKTVAHTLALGATTQRFSNWTMTGTLGNVVSVTGTSIMIYTGTAPLQNLDYLSLAGYGYSPNVTRNLLYAGANSTASGSFGWVYTIPPSDYMYFDNVIINNGVTIN